MANVLFPDGKEGLLDGSIVPSADDIRVALVRSYTYDAADRFLSDVTAGGGTIVVRTAAVTGKTVTDGIFDHADTTFGVVGAGAACAALIYYKYNAADSSARVIAFIDGATNLPITPNGGEITWVPDNGANKVFSL